MISITFTEENTILQGNKANIKFNKVISKTLKGQESKYEYRVKSSDLFCTQIAGEAESYAGYQENWQYSGWGLLDVEGAVSGQYSELIDIPIFKNDRIIQIEMRGQDTNTLEYTEIISSNIYCSFYNDIGTLEINNITRTKDTIPYSLNLSNFPLIRPKQISLEETFTIYQDAFTKAFTEPSSEANPNPDLTVSLYQTLLNENGESVDKLIISESLKDFKRLASYDGNLEIENLDTNIYVSFKIEISQIPSIALATIRNPILETSVVLLSKDEATLFITTGGIKVNLDIEDQVMTSGGMFNHSTYNIGIEDLDEFGNPDINKNTGSSIGLYDTYVPAGENQPRNEPNINFYDNEYNRLATIVCKNGALFAADKQNGFSLTPLTQYYINISEGTFGSGEYSLSQDIKDSICDCVIKVNGRKYFTSIYIDGAEGKTTVEMPSLSSTVEITIEQSDPTTRQEETVYPTLIKGMIYPWRYNYVTPVEFYPVDIFLEKIIKRA